MKTIYAFYAAQRYWPDEERLQAIGKRIEQALPDDGEIVLIRDDRPESAVPKGDCLVIIPLSGAVQRMMLADAATFDSVILYGAYIRGNVPADAAEGMLRANAAPALMDVWAVLRRTHDGAALALNGDDLKRWLRVAEAHRYVRGARLLKIGDTEPWVVSNASSSSVYEGRLGVEIVPVDQKTVVQRYESRTKADAGKYYEWFRSHATQILEPNDEDLWNASRMVGVFVDLIEEHAAAGAAIACFNLLKTGTNMCLSVSYINDCTRHFVSCEGDMDSAVTMLLMKKLTMSKLWMANPGLQPDGTINFSHCTAPICPIKEPLPMKLRSHHESGIGVSLQVDIPAGIRVTACRVSDDCGSVTIHRGTIVDGPYEAACRTQVHVRFDDFEHYIGTALGCHQVFAFEDISKDVEALASRFALKKL